MMTIRAAQLAAMMQAIARRVTAERELLNRLDAALGDGDHGTSISAAFNAAAADIAALDQPSASDLWTAAAKAMLNRMGGASGALFGTFFLKGVPPLRGKDRLNKSDMEAALLAGLQGVKARGKAEVGDKTMVDALEPAVLAFAAAEEFADGWRQAAEGARAGAESTRELPARRGRAKYLGERARGHIDPGATTIALLFEAIDGWWTGKA
ncbi:MAG: dihydroxyacetone kinase subunit DhaL [Chloroflexi bacterium]|nr:dihydroxyacetone kinase subunit DhaL [Chloroflexota bacterium]